ncbi:MAG: hypothetical protein ACKPKO_53115, partial [Candidatus Fonsibacter sp.]
QKNSVKMMEAHQARSYSGIAGHWQVESIPSALEGTPMILSIADDGRVLANSMRNYGKRVARTVYLQAYVCAGIVQTMTRPVVLTFQQLVGHQHRLAHDVPGEWVFPIRHNDVKLYAKEAARLVFDYIGIALCGSAMPVIELRRDAYFTRKARNTYNFLFVIPTPEEAGLADFEHPQLVKLELAEQTHSIGSKVLLPILPGPFGDYKWYMGGASKTHRQMQNLAWVLLLAQSFCGGIMWMKYLTACC